MDGTGAGAETLVGTGVAGNRYNYAIRSLHDRLNATYTVKACNTAGCGPASAPLAMNANLAIGYIKASNPDRADHFAESMAVSEDGNTLVVGATAEASNAAGVNGDQTNNALRGAGAVYVFTRSAGVWAQQAYLKASNPMKDAKFGSSVSVSADGNTLAVGASGEGGESQGINGDQSNVGTSYPGAVYVFSRSGGAWAQEAYVKASNSKVGFKFGSAVALSSNGNVMAVGAPGASVSGNTSLGAAYVFTRTSGTWAEQTFLIPSQDWAGHRHRRRPDRQLGLERRRGVCVYAFWHCLDAVSLCEGEQCRGA
ncbi:MAG: hypothetical protein EOO32_07110 [Comamonadaceae bacterium]|nr:MAG: hypothetical protein EOO32_07110 [Comamonadaceae bacterium]